MIVEYLIMTTETTVNIIFGSDYYNHNFKKQLISYLHNNHIIGSSYDVCINFDKLNHSDKYTEYIDEVCRKTISSSYPRTYGVLISSDGIDTKYLAGNYRTINCGLIVNNEYMAPIGKNPVNCFSIDSRFSTIENCANTIKDIVSNDNFI